MKIKITTENVFKRLEEVSILYNLSNLEGNYKVGNKCYHEIIKIVKFIKKNNLLDRFKNYLSSNEIGVRIVVATFLLPYYEDESLQILKNISNGNGIIATNAEIIISEWKKGNLKLI